MIPFKLWRENGVENHFGLNRRPNSASRPQPQAGHGA